MGRTDGSVGVDDWPADGGGEEQTVASTRSGVVIDGRGGVGGSGTVWIEERSDVLGRGIGSGDAGKQAVMEGATGLICCNACVAITLVAGRGETGASATDNVPRAGSGMSVAEGGGGTMAIGVNGLSPEPTA